MGDQNVVKVVTSFDQSDRQKLRRSFSLVLDGDPEAHGFLDISTLAKELGHTSLGLKKIAAFYGLRIEKMQSVSVSNWAAKHLSNDQVRYGAEDAWFPLLLVRKLLADIYQKNHVELMTELRMNVLSALDERHETLVAMLTVQDCAAQPCSGAGCHQAYSLGQ